MFGRQVSGLRRGQEDGYLGRAERSCREPSRARLSQNRYRRVGAGGYTSHHQPPERPDPDRHGAARRGGDI